MVTSSSVLAALCDIPRISIPGGSKLTCQHLDATDRSTTLAAQECLAIPMRKCRREFVTRFGRRTTAIRRELEAFRSETERSAALLNVLAQHVWLIEI